MLFFRLFLKGNSFDDIDSLITTAEDLRGRIEYGASSGLNQLYCGSFELATTFFLTNFIAIHNYDNFCCLLIGTLTTLTQQYHPTQVSVRFK